MIHLSFGINDRIAIKERFEKVSLSPVDWFVFQPLRFPNGDWQPDDLLFEDCFFPTADGTMLHGWWCPTETSAPTVFYLHGNRGHLASRAWIVIRLQKFFGWNIFIFDYRGYGRSEGSPRMKHFLKDAEAAFEYLCRQQELDPADLLVVGRSLGGAVAAHIAIQNQTKALIVECTFTSLLDAASVSWPRWLVRPVIMGRLNTLSIIDQFTGPLIIGHGEDDELIPFEHGQQLFEKASNPKYFFAFPGQNHRDHPPDWFWEEVGKILNSRNESDANNNLQQ